MENSKNNSKPKHEFLFLTSNKRIFLVFYPFCVFLVTPQLLPPQNLLQLIFCIVVFLSAYIILGFDVYWIVRIMKDIYKKRKERKKW